MASFLVHAIAEVRAWPRNLMFWWLMVAAPLAGTGVMSVILSTGDMQGLPVALCDQDNSSLSRKIARWLRAIPSVDITHVVASPEEGNELMRTGQVYAFVHIPRNFERDVLRNRPARPRAFLEGQHLSTAGVLNRDFTALGLTFWHELDRELRLRSGVPAGAASAQSSTLSLDLRPISNPASNYRIFLLPGLLPAILQLLITIFMVWELEKTAAKVAQSTDKRLTPVSALLGTLAPIALWSWLLGCGLAGLLVLSGDLTLQNGFGVILVSYLMFTLAATGLSLLLYGLESSIVGRLSYVSVLSSPAFAFAGLAFPLFSMPLPGQIWANLLPLTHLIQIQTQSGVLGATLAGQWFSFLALFLLFVCDGGLGLRLSIKRIRSIRHAALSSPTETAGGAS